MIICDFCGDSYHLQCHNPKVESVPKEPWYCTKCLNKINTFSRKDITIDFNVLKYL